MSNIDVEKLKNEADELVNLVGNKGSDESKELFSKFELHIEHAKNLCNYKSDLWDHKWKQNIYVFGDKLKINQAQELLKILDFKIKEINKEEHKEVFDFFKSEIYANTYPTNESIEKLRDYIGLYPSNPEFRNTLGYIYLYEKDYLEAIKHIRIAYDLDKNFKDQLFVAYSKYLENLIDLGHYKKGLSLCKSLLDEKIFHRNIIDNTYHMLLINYNNRFQDYISLKEKIKSAEDKIEKIISEKTTKSQFKVIEILGFFTAIIAFIFSTLSIGNNFSYSQAIVFNISLGLILLMFVVTVNLFFSTKKIKWNDFRFLILVIITLTILLIVFKKI